ncbi:discoidin domain-containing protein [Pedobacter rhodius]|uniref:Discoidin domain-containing protein n=1 Tax=Pedobacter rhodius TaxID=3004098 RepID=A0ABT4KX51_9SPHI|nr:discoidin domain-containing protein [Pedobacter sp. SJ11]MCZ4222448.1 discoidin domain-containing protein [Pedobacter sp. SJ11]
MKKIMLSLLAGVALLITSCDKADGILFEDKSTAIKADKSSWTATADSETPDGLENTGKASAVLDNNLATYWHTDYSVSNPDYPHWILIDMKKDYKLVTVVVTNRQGATPNKSGMKKFSLQGSSNGTTFSNLGTFNFAITNDPQSFPVSSASAYRYLKLTALESQTGTTKHTFLAEIDVFTVK